MIEKQTLYMYTLDQEQYAAANLAIEEQLTGYSQRRMLIKFPRMQILTGEILHRMLC